MDNVLLLDTIKSYIRNSKPDIKETTIKTYIDNINILIKENTTKAFNLDELIKFLTDYTHINKILTAKFTNIVSIANYYNSIIVTLKAILPVNEINNNIIKIYTDKHKELKNEHYEFNIKNTQSKKELKNWVSLQDIADIKEALYTKLNKINIKKTNLLLKTLQYFLILSLYSELPPLRNDYAKVIVINENNKDFVCDDTIDVNYNYLNIKTSQLILCNYKTNKTYGTKKIDIPEELIALIKHWEKTKKEILGDKLTTHSLLINIYTLTPMTSNYLTKILNKIFYPKKVSTTILRKVYLSNKYPIIHNYKEMLDDSYIMGHSVNTQQLLYRRKIE